MCHVFAISPGLSGPPLLIFVLSTSMVYVLGALTRAPCSYRVFYAMLSTSKFTNNRHTCQIFSLLSGAGYSTLLRQLNEVKME